MSNDANTLPKAAQALQAPGDAIVAALDSQISCMFQQSVAGDPRTTLTPLFRASQCVCANALACRLQAYRWHTMLGVGCESFRLPYPSRRLQDTHCSSPLLLVTLCTSWALHKVSFSLQFFVRAATPQHKPPCRPFVLLTALAFQTDGCAFTTQRLERHTTGTANQTRPLTRSQRGAQQHQHRYTFGTCLFQHRLCICQPMHCVLLGA